jgi:opacity protein-like surface antigen
MRRVLYPILMSLTVVGVAYPQSTEVPRFSGSISGGFTEPVYSTGQRFDTGWNAGAGVGVNISRYLGVEGQFQWNDLDVNSTTLTGLGFPNGYMHMWSATIDPVIHFAPSNKFNPYIIGGGGLYHVTTAFTAPTVATFVGFDPFFGIYAPFAVGANQVLQSTSIYKPGWNVGAGFSIPLGSSKMKLFAEARYNYMYTSPKGISILPVSFGIRW